MAALLIIAAIAMSERIDKRRTEKREYDSARYRALQLETARQNSMRDGENENVIFGGEEELDADDPSQLHESERAADEAVKRDMEFQEKDAEARKKRRQKVAKILRFGTKK